MQISINKILDKINAMKKAKKDNSESDKDSEDLDYVSEKLNDSIRSDELDDLLNSATSGLKESKSPLISQ